jgi:hypothetical protein
MDINERPSTAAWRYAVLELMRLEMSQVLFNNAAPRSAFTPKVVELAQSESRPPLCVRSLLTMDNLAEVPFSDPKVSVWGFRVYGFRV